MLNYPRQRSAARILAVGDMHLGRRPSRVPADLADWGIRPGDVTPVAAWRRVVELAVERQVHAVVLAGDVVESDNEFFEAYGPLHAGVQRLAAAGIPVIGVAGNHDVHVLPRLADEVPGFTLLGRDGRWEEHVVAVDGQPAVRFLGWSFPEKIVRASPLDSVPQVSDDLPTIGLLHCDLDVRGSPYAPITSAALAGAPGDAWLLGHIHAPSANEGPSPRGYLGNLSALDPGELGARGAWMLGVTGPGNVSLSRLPVARLRWERVEVQVADLAEPDDLEGAIVRAVRALDERIAGSIGETRAIGCRVKLVGASPIHRALVASLGKKEANSLRAPVNDRVYFVESVDDESRQEVDIDRVALGNDPPGLLARSLLAIERDTEVGRRLVREAAADLARTADLPSWSQLDAITDPEATARRHLLAAGRIALEELLAQRETK